MNANIWICVENNTTKYLRPMNHANCESYHYVAAEMRAEKEKIVAPDYCEVGRVYARDKVREKLNIVNMKKLIFIDNDGIESARKCCDTYVIPFLEVYGGLDKDYCNSIEIMPDLYSIERDKLYNMFYSGEQAIVSWSVYTPTSFSNSQAQLLNFLRVAGSSSVSNVIYIDMSGMITEALSRTLQYDDVKGTYSIIKAITKNWIITLKDGEFKRLQFQAQDDECFVLEPVSLTDLLK